MTAARTAIAGLIFSEDFDRPSQAMPSSEPKPLEPVYSAADLQTVRAEALRDGHAAGMAESDAATTALARHALLTIAERLETARAEASAIAEESAEAIGRLIMDSFAIAFPALCAGHAEVELRAIVRAVLPRLRDEPAISIRVNPPMAEALTREIAMLDPAISERIKIVPSTAVAVGDLRIAWRSGDARRDTAMLWSEIENVLAPAALLTGKIMAPRHLEAAPQGGDVQPWRPDHAGTAAAPGILPAKIGAAPHSLTAKETERVE